MSLGGLYNDFIYEPIFNLLVLLYDVSGRDIGLAIILMTAVIKGVLWPLSAKALKSQKAMQELQPKMEALKKKYAAKEQKEELGKAMMELYSQEKINPASSCLPTLVQLPVFIALYQAMSHGLSSSGFDKLYAWVPNPGAIDPHFLFGLLDLSKPNYVLAVLAALAQFYQAKMMLTKPPPNVKGAEDEAVATIVNKQMVYMMPVMTIIIGIKLPGGLMIYWLAMTLLTILQQRISLGKRTGRDGVQGSGGNSEKESMFMKYVNRLIDKLQPKKV